MSLSSHNYRYYDIILALFASILLISNISAIKLISFGDIITDGGALLFPLTYIFGDVLTEVYGYRRARRAIWTGFGVMLLATASFYIVGKMPAAAEWSSQQSYDDILGFFPRIVVASLAAYLVGEFVNAFILAKMKVQYKGKRLGLRLIGSTVVGQFVDTLVFGLVAFGGILDRNAMVRFLLIGWAFKTTVEVVLLPLTYWIIGYLKRAEQTDVFDKKTNFSPFSMDA